MAKKLKTLKKDKVPEEKVIACPHCGGEVYKFAIEGGKSWYQCVKCSRKCLL